MYTHVVHRQVFLLSSWPFPKAVDERGNWKWPAAVTSVVANMDLCGPRPYNRKAAIIRRRVPCGEICCARRGAPGACRSRTAGARRATRETHASHCAAARPPPPPRPTATTNPYQLPRSWRTSYSRSRLMPQHRYKLTVANIRAAIREARIRRAGYRGVTQLHFSTKKNHLPFPYRPPLKTVLNNFYTCGNNYP